MGKCFALAGLILILSLYNNCAPSFQSMNDLGSTKDTLIDPGNNNQGNPGGSLGGAPIPPPRVSSKTMVINKHKFNPGGDQFKFSCEGSELEIPQLQPGKLTKVELQNSLKNVLGVEGINLSIYPDQSDTNKFRASNLYITENSFFSSMSTIAKDVANQFIKSLESNSNSSWNCDFKTECMNSLKQNLPKYIWRKKLSPAELATLNKMFQYNQGDSIEVAKEKLYDFVFMLVNSPQFFIKKNLSTNFNTTKRLATMQILNRLSFFLASSAPTKELIDSYSDEAELSTDQIRSIAQQILSDNDTKMKFIKQFLLSYLTLNNTIQNPNKFYGTPIKDIVSNDIENLYQLFASNKPLSELISNVEAGILTNKTFSFTTFGTTKDSSPIKRGTTILSNILCEELPSLPPATFMQIREVASTIPEHFNNMQVMEYHRSIGSCASCHNVIDPPAIGLEVLGPSGELRVNYPNGDKIEAVGSLGDNPFNDLPSYLNVMSNSIDFKSCFANHLNSAVNFSSQYKYNSCLVNSLFGENEDVGMMDLVYNFVTSNNFLWAKKPTYN